MASGTNSAPIAASTSTTTRAAQRGHGAALADEHVTQPAHRTDAVARELAAQRMHVNFQCVAVHAVVAEHGFLERAARDHAPGAFGERAQQQEFALGQGDALTVERGITADGVEHQPAFDEDIVAQSARAAMDRSQPRGEFVEMKRFDQVIVRAAHRDRRRDRIPHRAR